MWPTVRPPLSLPRPAAAIRSESTGGHSTWAASCPAAPEAHRLRRVAAMLATALLMASPLSASAGESVDIYQKASRSFADQVQGSVQTHLSQIRARQQRLIRARGRDLPRFMNQLELADSSSSIPLQPIPYLRDTGNRLLHSAPGKTNVYIRGTLYSINNGDGLGLTTPGTIIGSDQLVKEDVAIGFATGRITTRKSSGTLVSAYLSMQPTSALMVDMSLSLGQHRARNDFLQSYANGRLGVSGYSQALSLSVNRQPQLFRGWTFSPYSRYDVVATRIEAGRLDANHWHGSRAQSSLSFGSVMETEWFGMFGPIQPRLQLEVRHQIADGSGLVNTRYKTHGMIGLGLTSRLSRDMATFAESRYATESGSANPESLLMLGIRLFF